MCVQRRDVIEAGLSRSVSGERRSWALALSSPWACVLAGGALNLSYAPFSLWWLAWVLLFPLWAVSRHPDPWLRLRRGFLFGLAMFAPGLFWLAHTLVLHVGFGWPAALAANLFVACLCALFVAGFAWLAGYFRQGAWVWFAAISLLWLCLEALRFRFLTGLPWLSLGLSQIEGPLAGFVPLVGELGVSALLCAGSVALFCLLSLGHWRSRLLLPGLSILVLLVSGELLRDVSWTRVAGPPLSMALVQPATPQPEKREPQFDQKRLRELSLLSEPYLGRADLILWPETVVSMEREAVARALSGFDLAADIRGSTLLLGVFETRAGRLYNKTMTLGRQPGHLYAKHHLVPLGETVHPGFRFLENWVPGDTGRGVGEDYEPLILKGQGLGVSICWEGSFSRDIVPSVRAGAGGLINLANEAWFWGTTSPAQNLDAFRLRAMETGRPAVRLANFGPSGLIDARGRVKAALAADHPEVLMVEMAPRQGNTPFLILGGARLVGGAWVLLGLLSVWLLVRNRKAKMFGETPAQPV